MLFLESVEYRDNYKLFCVFSNGQNGVVDLQDALWGPVFEPLKNIEVFKQFKLSHELHTVCWENGADFAPEFLHSRCM